MYNTSSNFHTLYPFRSSGGINDVIKRRGFEKMSWFFGKAKKDSKKDDCKEEEKGKVNGEE